MTKNTTDNWREDLRQHAFIINPIKYPDFKGEDAVIRVGYIETFIESILADRDREVVEEIGHKLLDGMPIKASGDAQLTLDETRRIIFEILSQRGLKDKI